MLLAPARPAAAPSQALTTQQLLRKFDLRMGAVGGLDPRFTLLREVTFVLLDVGTPGGNGNGSGSSGSAINGSIDGGAGGGAAVPTAALFPEDARLRSEAAALGAALRGLRARGLRSEVRSLPAYPGLAPFSGLGSAMLPPQAGRLFCFGSQADAPLLAGLLPPQSWTNRP